MIVLGWILAVIASLEQAFDVGSTSLVLSKNRGHEAWGPTAFVMKHLGKYWGLYKIPVVALILGIAYTNDGSWKPIAVLGVIVAIYAYVVVNNYRVAWRQI